MSNATRVVQYLLQHPTLEQQYKDLIKLEIAVPSDPVLDALKDTILDTTADPRTREAAIKDLVVAQKEEVLAATAVEEA